VARRWTVIASGLLILALALVVMYTNRTAFLSPIALVVVSAIGLAALLLQVRFRGDFPAVHSPLWLNVVGVICALVAVVADYLGLSIRAMALASFGAVGCFGISGMLILQSLRRHRRQTR
jgi:hypothetical protein